MNEVDVQNLPIDMIPLEKDVLSLEENTAIKDLYIKEDTKVLAALVRSIIKFETVFGRVKYKYAKGDYACIVKNLLEEEEKISPFETDSEILACVILDRSTDFITPLCFQVNYFKLIKVNLRRNDR